jgi:hypothetical protein
MIIEVGKKSQEDGKKLYNEKLHNFYSSPHIHRMMSWAGNEAHMEEVKNVYKNLV